MLQLTDLISWGATRECYHHPTDDSHCIKVMQKGKSAETLQQELNIYRKLKQKLGNFICHYTPELVSTNKGLGLECELIIDDNQQPSQPLLNYVQQQKLSAEIQTQLQTFFQILLDNNIFFYDFNLMNFVVQERSQHQRLIYIDLKSYRHYKPWTYLGLERFFRPLARHIMRRRIRSLYHKMNLSSPF